MHDKPKESPALGLELTSQTLVGAQLIYEGQRAKLCKLFSYAIDTKDSNEFHVKLLYIGDEEQEFERLIKKSLVVTAIPSSEVLVRTLAVQLVKDRDIDAVLEFQTEPLLPYPIEEAIIDRITVEKGGETSQLTVTAAKIEQIASHLELWHSLNIEPEVISCAPAALAAFASNFSPPEDDLLINLHIGDIESLCVLLDKGKLVAAQTILAGVNEWTGHLSKDTQTSFEQATEAIKTLELSHVSEEKTPLLSEDLKNFLLEAKRIYYAFGKQTQGRRINTLFLTGKGGSISLIQEALKTQLEQNISYPKPTDHFPVTSEELQHHALPIGMALTALPSTKEQINFRQKNYLYPYPWKRLKKPVGTYLASCILLAFAIYTFGNATIASREVTLAKSYLNLLALVKKPYEEIEEKIKGTSISEELLTGEISVASLSQQDLRQRLSILMKEVRQTPDIFPLYPNIPRVSDVLAWLSTNPYIVEREEGKNEKKARIQVESFSYKLVKRPEKNKMREKYQAKVEMEFSTPIPRYAREFHDFLLSPNDYVDLKTDVKWNAERGRYRTSFFLKDKTQYPSSR